MTEERLKVLEILQEGKISADDAAQLLEVIGKTAAKDGETEKRVVKVRIQKDGEDCCGETEDEDCCGDETKAVGVVCVAQKEDD